MSSTTPSPLKPIEKKKKQKVSGRLLTLQKITLTLSPPRSRRERGAHMMVLVGCLAFAYCILVRQYELAILSGAFAAVGLYLWGKDPPRGIL